MSNLSSVRFTCTALANSPKTGMLKPDADGYYETILGGLNVYNSVGEYYTAEGARELFANNGLLRKRIEKGRLRSEYGHPKQLPGESDQAFMNRIFLINEDRVCGHFKEVYLDDTRVKYDNGQPAIVIVGKVKPAGPFGKCLQESLDNQNENVCFSIRAFTDDKMIRGTNHRTLKTIVTWDYVNDPGIPTAEKWKSPSLENYNTKDLMDMRLGRGQIERMVNSIGGTGIAQESAKMTIDELMCSMGWDINRNDKPAFCNW